LMYRPICWPFGGRSEVLSAVGGLSYGCSSRGELKWRPIALAHSS